MFIFVSLSSLRLTYTSGVYRHLLFLLTLNDRLFLAPLDNPKTVIDIGTGIGIWAQ